MISVDGVFLSSSQKYPGMLRLSARLSPHESDDTDVILFGHSLGGILSAEVALLPSGPGSSAILRHRILGLINFDVPFLGVHPRVIPTGIGSLFNPHSPSPHDASPPPTTTTATDLSDSISHKLSSVDLDDKDENDRPFSNPFAVPSHDPNFDPAFPNDIRLARRNQLDGALHFIKKNSDHLVGAVQGYFKSYFEFGGCLLDYSGLKSRYRKLRELEEIDELDLKRDAQGRLRRRVRFVNYYTASTGFIPSGEPSPSPSPMKLSENMTPDTQLTQSISQTSRGQEIVEEQARSPISSPQPHAGDTQAEAENCHVLTPDDISLPQASIDTGSPQEHSSSKSSIIESLPPLPPIPQEPPTFDPSRYPDKDTLKVAQKEHTRSVKAYERAKKDHEKATKDREKLAKKLEKAATKRQVQEQQKTAAAAAVAAVEQDIAPNTDNKDKGSGIVVIVQKEDKAEQSSSSSTIDASYTSSSSLKTKTAPPLPPRNPNRNLASIANERKSEKLLAPSHHGNDSAIFSPLAPSPSATPATATAQPPPKDRKFCALPSTTINGQTGEPLWVRIFMSGIDEVVAHQSMFLPNDIYYEQLVGDTATRIERWVQDDCTRRVILSQLQGEETEPLD
jgi:hypothetical protein